MASLIYVTDNAVPVVFPLGKATLLIGRDEGMTIQLPDVSVSRNHATVVYESGLFVVHDNGSANGTFVNGQQTRRQELKHHDVLRFGEYVFLVDLSGVEQPKNPISKSQQIRNHAMVENIEVRRKGQEYRTTVDFQPLKQNPQSAPMRMLLTTPVTIPYRPDYSKASFLCGCFGFLLFVPAIMLGHLSAPMTERAKIHRSLGLLLGYLFLFVWLGVFSYFFFQ